MPIYEYRCRDCGKVTEKIARSSQKEIICPVCNGKAERIVSMFSNKVSSNNSSGGCMPSSGFG